MLGAALLALGMAGAPGGAAAVGEDPAAEVAEALRSFGPPGLVWGRLAIEEESPVGAWTPLGGVEVTLYPATPTLVTELERIRQSARTSGAQYESAVARVQAALAVHQGRVDRQTAPPPSLEEGLVAEPPLVASPRTAKPAEARHAWRQKTDPAGLFVFDAVPSGDWLVVAIRVSPYAAEKLRAEPRPCQTAPTKRFLPRAASPAKDVELWVTRVRVVTGERVALELTDRARWLAGPVR